MSLSVTLKSSSNSNIIILKMFKFLFANSVFIFSKKRCFYSCFWADHYSFKCSLKIFLQHKHEWFQVNVEDDFYFMTDPENFIYSHWPHQTEWQFLQRKISLSEFEDLPFVKPYYFKTNVTLGWTEKPVIRTNHGVVTWTLRYAKPLKFGYKLIPVTEENKPYKGPDLKTTLYQETKVDETRFVFRAPKSGTYICKFYAKSLEPEDAKKHLTEIVEYRIEVKEPAPDAAPLPQCIHTVWGAGIRARKVILDTLNLNVTVLKLFTNIQTTFFVVQLFIHALIECILNFVYYFAKCSFIYLNDFKMFLPEI